MAELVPAEGPYLDAVLDASHALWHEGLTRRAYAQYYAAQRKTAWGRAHLERFALIEGGDVIASAKRYDLTVSLDGRAVRTAGIGAVFTQQAHRSRGHGRAIVERLLERSAADGFELALLFSEIGADYYAALGFDEIPTFDLTLRVTESRTARRAGHARARAATIATSGTSRRSGVCAPNGTRFTSSATKRSSGTRLRKSACSPGSGRRARARSVLHHRRRRHGRRLRRHHRERRRWTLEECGDRDPTGARVGAILQTLIAQEPSAKRPIIRGWLPTGFLPPQVTIVGQQRSSEVMMIRGLTGPTPKVRAEDVLFWRSDVF